MLQAIVELSDYDKKLLDRFGPDPNKPCPIVTLRHGKQIPCRLMGRHVGPHTWEMEPAS